MNKYLLGIGIGLCFGVAFMQSMGPAGIGIGLCIGVAIGSSFATSEKKKNEKPEKDEPDGDTDEKEE